MGINTGLKLYETICSVDEHKQTGAVSSRGGQVSVLVPDCLVLVVVGTVSAIFITHENDVIIQYMHIIIRSTVYSTDGTHQYQN